MPEDLLNSDSNPQNMGDVVDLSQYIANSSGGVSARDIYPNFKSEDFAGYLNSQGVTNLNDYLFPKETLDNNYLTGYYQGKFVGNVPIFAPNQYLPPVAYLQLQADQKRAAAEKKAQQLMSPTGIKTPFSTKNPLFNDAIRESFSQFVDNYAVIADQLSDENVDGWKVLMSGKSEMSREFLNGLDFYNNMVRNIDYTQDTMVKLQDLQNQGYTVSSKSAKVIDDYYRGAENAQELVFQNRFTDILGDATAHVAYGELVKAGIQDVQAIITQNQKINPGYTIETYFEQYGDTQVKELARSIAKQNPSIVYSEGLYKDSGYDQAYKKYNQPVTEDDVFNLIKAKLGVSEAYQFDEKTGKYTRVSKEINEPYSTGSGGGSGSDEPTIGAALEYAFGYVDQLQQGKTVTVGNSYIKSEGGLLEVKIGEGEPYQVKAEDTYGVLDAVLKLTGEQKSVYGLNYNITTMWAALQNPAYYGYTNKANNFTTPAGSGEAVRVKVDSNIYSQGVDEMGRPKGEKKTGVDYMTSFMSGYGYSVRIGSDPTLRLQQVNKTENGYSVSLTMNGLQNQNGVLMYSTGLDDKTRTMSGYANLGDESGGVGSTTVGNFTFLPGYMYKEDPKNKGFYIIVKIDNPKETLKAPGSSTNIRVSKSTADGIYISAMEGVYQTLNADTKQVMPTQQGIMEKPAGDTGNPELINQQTIQTGQ